MLVVEEGKDFLFVGICLIGRVRNLSISYENEPIPRLYLMRIYFAAKD